MNTCTKRGCTRRAFVNSDRCFDHQKMPGGVGFKAWAAFCAVLGLVLIGVGAWAVIAIVSWVTSK